MTLLKHHLEAERRFNAHVFSYPSVRGTLDDNAHALVSFARGLGAEALHLVGHSLGGIVALRALASADDLPPGRVVCLGSPLCGSQAASALLAKPWGKYVVGDALSQVTLSEPAADWAADVVGCREVGVIAGSRSAGLGRWFAGFEQANDGTVTVQETRLPGAKDHLVLAVSHTGMVVSRDVAEQTAAFLRRGEFLREA